MLVALLALLLAQSLPEPQRAATPPPAPQAVLPPRLISSPPAPYPDGARGEARVVLQLEVDPQGLPRNVHVVSPAQPVFDEAALAWARALRFEPATQGGKPVAVRIQSAINFVPPPLPPPKEINFAGAVRERGTRKKLQGIEVQVAGQSAITDVEGQFAFRGLPSGAIHVTIVAPGYQRYERDEDLPEDKRLTVEYRLQPLSVSPFEATVEGERSRKEISVTSVDKSEFQVIPGSQGDALKVVEDLPGVARTSPIGGGMLVIRGSDPGDSLVYLDGEPIPLLYHFGAISSTFNPDLLEAIDYIPGNFSVRYGDLTGGLVDVRERKLREEPHGYANINLLEASAMLELAVPQVPGLSLAVAARRSYIDLILQAVVPSGGDVGLTVAPRYYDAQFRVDYAPPGSHHKLSLLALSSDDTLGLLITRPLQQDPNISGSIDAETGFQQLRLKHEWKSGNSSLTTLGMFEKLTIGFSAGSTHLFLNGHDFYLRSTFNHDLSDSLGLSAGVDIANRRIGVAARYKQSFLFREGDYNSQGPRPDDPFIFVPPQLFSRFTPAIWGEVRFKPLANWLLTAGLRGDLYHYSPANPNSTGTVSPRLTTRYDVTDSFALKAGLGLYSQGARNGDAAVPFGNPYILPERAWQATLGSEWKPMPGVFLSVEGFYKSLWDMIVNAPAGAAYTLDNAGVGRVFGLEVLLRKELTRNFFGWISYTLSRSDRLDRPGEQWRKFDFDQPQNLTVISSYKFGGSGWQVGGRLRVISGNPDTPVIGSRYLANYDAYLPVYGPVNSERLPLFHQLDVRVDKTWTFDSWLLDLYLDVLNVYNRRSIEGSAYSYDFSQRSYFQGLPVIPTLGAKGSF